MLRLSRFAWMHAEQTVCQCKEQGHRFLESLRKKIFICCCDKPTAGDLVRVWLTQEEMLTNCLAFSCKIYSVNQKAGRAHSYVSWFWPYQYRLELLWETFFVGGLSCIWGFPLILLGKELQSWIRLLHFCTLDQWFSALWMWSWAEQQTQLETRLCCNLLNIFIYFFCVEIDGDR